MAIFVEIFPEKGIVLSPSGCSVQFVSLSCFWKFSELRWSLFSKSACLFFAVYLFIIL